MSISCTTWLLYKLSQFHKRKNGEMSYTLYGMNLTTWFNDSHLQLNVIIIFIAKKSQENHNHLLLWEQIHVNSFPSFSKPYYHQKNIPETVGKVHVEWISSSRNFSTWIIQYLLSCILFIWRKLLLKHYLWDLFQCMALPLYQWV